MKKWMNLLSLMTFALCIWLGAGGKAYAAADVLENENFRLELVNNYSELRLTDKATGDVWSSSMSDSAFDVSAVNTRWQARMQSLFSLTVTDLKRGVGVVTSYDLAGSQYTAETYDTDYGLGVRYDLTQPGVKICVEVGLTENGCSLRVPSGGIEEYGGTFSVVSMNLMQFFAGAVDDQEGYIVYPDGSGAIMRFDDPSHQRETSVTYNVYGNILNNQNLKGRFEAEEALVLLPVFGANYGEKGFVAYITVGEESSQIVVTPSTQIVKANYVYPIFQFRRGFNDPRVTTSSIIKYDDDRLMTDYEIRYEILPHGRAEYADMASAYREYLLQSGQLAQGTGSGKLALSLDLFMGIKEEGLIFDTFQSVTTFEQAQEILEDLSASIDADIEASLLGWTKSGYGTEPKYFPVNSKLGGNKGLSKLAQYASENGISLSLAANFMTVDAEASGYSQNTDIVFLGNYQVLTNLRSSIRVISPDTALKNYEKFMKTAKKYSLSGLKLENLGDMLYYSYGNRNYTLATECKANWQQMLSETKEAFGSVTSEGGNLYALAIADKVTEIPINDLGYQMTTTEIPFYQIVVHGAVKYTGEALNLSSDSGRLLLKWIEYGYTPYFEITFESAEKLINTDYNELFTSRYEEWKDEIVSACGQMQAALGEVQNARIISHEQLKEDVFCTGYDNGVKIYVNYRDEAVTVDGITVGALDWEVSR